MDGDFHALAQKLLGQDQDLAFAIQTEAGDFTVVSFDANEAVNTPFEIHLNLSSDDPDIDLHELMDTQVCLAIFSKYSEVRYLNGIVFEASRGDQGMRRTMYSLVLRPALARLAHISDGKIWQHKSVVEIATELLAQHHVRTVEWLIEGDHQPREYCTQIPGERTLAFITRILNEEGIFYMHSHSQDQHSLIFTDAPLATPILPHAETVTYNNMPGGQSRGFWISRFSQHERLRSNDYELGEYWFRNPAGNFNQGRSAQEENGTSSQYPLYDFPGRYKDPQGVGKHFAKHRIEAERVDATTGQGVTNHIHLCPGYHFSIADHGDAKANISHFLLSVSHSGQQPAALQEDAPASEPTTYEAQFTTMPGRLPYRPPVPAKPVMDGSQIGIVVGPEGEEIYTDEMGRVRIWLPWDRHAERRQSDGQRGEHSSCWMRVSQNWAGGNWGSIAIPRIGQEVVVQYFDSDADQPYISGRMYHEANRPPYKLPEHKTRMTIKSQTHKGEGFNELRFEDEAGKEEVFIHAQKDRNEKTLHNHTERIDNNWVQSVGHNKAVQVQNNHNEIIGGNMTLTVGPSGIGQIVNSTFNKLTQGIGDVAKRLGVKAGLNPGEGNLSIVVEKGKTETIGAVSATNVGVSHYTTAGVSIEMTGGKSVGIHAGKRWSETVGKTKNVTVGESISFVCGASRFDMDADGNISIDGTNITINGQELITQTAPKIKLN
ncbi:type VI secretion system Vgr family protein [Halocynthiibacter namhaensis]|uniref:type VI secretion system Vgr family protein n=1 Tax=Halocynthiibacter namhaensis TaxID=1290553 RepID=UPI00138E0555|nr:type VI secretion system tip protein TssI/VgrG [Halocynthiibacter namhaensis]